MTGSKITVAALAAEVDDALAELAHAEGERAEALELLRLAEERVATRKQRVGMARERMFEEYPVLRSDIEVPVTASDVTLAGNSQYEIVEVDDADDPRFTAGASASVDGDDNTPLPAVEFTEREA